MEPAILLIILNSTYLTIQKNLQEFNYRLELRKKLISVNGCLNFK
jgi:hypothetical protein